VAEPPAPSEVAPAPAPAPAAVPPADAAPPPPVPAAPTGRRYLKSSRRLSLQLPPPALFGLQYPDARLALGVPNVEVRHAYTRTERMMFNAPDVAEVRIPVLDVSF
jgi:hypothetical protein